MTQMTSEAETPEEEGFFLLWFCFLFNNMPFPPLGDLPNPGIKLVSPVFLMLQADSLPTEP